MPCPITGVAADGSEPEHGISAQAAFAALEADPDIEEERRTLERGEFKSAALPALPERERATQGGPPARLAQPLRLVPLSVIGGKHSSNAETRRLVREAGGLPMLRSFTTSFYKKAFADKHIDQFIKSHLDPHGERFASWVAEKLGDGTPWTDERRTRPRQLLQIGPHTKEVSYDRSSAHMAAWHSPKRPAHKFGDHFKPDDARVWMRLHFWAMRDVGLFEPEYAEFMDYYTRFIGHFISVYSSKSPPFTRESARWSAHPRNIQDYLAAGNVMADVVGVSVEDALRELPADERAYTGSRAHDCGWPYELARLG